MAKKKDDFDIEDVEKKENKLVSTIITIVVILIWIAIIAILIKLDVGEFGTKITPIFKDVPVINKILPENTSEKTENDEDYPYKSLGDAISYIKELEVQLADKQKNNGKLKNKNEDLQKEVDRLKVFENNQKEFESLKKQFSEEVVFGEDAIDYENYMKYYELISPDVAKELYEEAVDRYACNEAYMEQADAYARMEPDAAAAIFIEMTGDLDIVINLLKCMKSADRAEIIGAISEVDPNYAGKLTKLIVP
ncbi:MAG: hypothetical protein IJC76_07605 [Lachnospiraceae bacterium]|nr:hypothetical protein [Lachnospiraceae bacterium]